MEQVCVWDGEGELTPSKGDPAGVSGGHVVPIWHHQQSTGDSQGHDAQDDEEERDDPLSRQLWRDAGPFSAMEGLALPDKTHIQKSCEKRGRIHQNQLHTWNCTGN